MWTLLLIICSWTLVALLNNKLIDAVEIYYKGLVSGKTTGLRILSVFTAPIFLLFFTLHFSRAIIQGLKGRSALDVLKEEIEK